MYLHPIYIVHKINIETYRYILGNHRILKYGLSKKTIRMSLSLILNNVPQSRYSWKILLV